TNIYITEYAKTEDLPEIYETRFKPILEIEEFFKIDRSFTRFYGVKNLKDGKKMSAVSPIYINHLLECIREIFLEYKTRIELLEKFKNQTTQELNNIQYSISNVKTQLNELKEKVEGGNE